MRSVTEAIVAIVHDGAVSYLAGTGNREAASLEAATIWGHQEAQIHAELYRVRKARVGQKVKCHVIPANEVGHA